MKLRFRNPLRPWIKCYPATESHLQHVQPSLTATKAPGRTGLGPPLHTEKATTPGNRPQRRHSSCLRRWIIGKWIDTPRDCKACRRQNASYSHSLSSKRIQTGFRISTWAQSPRQGSKYTVLGPLGRTNSIPRHIGYITSIFWTELTPSGYPGVCPSTYCQHSYAFLTLTPDGAPSPDTLAIRTVTPITCHKSQVTGESTCPMECVHSKWEPIDPQHVVNNIHDLAHVL